MLPITGSDMAESNWEIEINPFSRKSSSRNCTKWPNAFLPIEVIWLFAKFKTVKWDKPTNVLELNTILPSVHPIIFFSQSIKRI